MAPPIRFDEDVGGAGGGGGGGASWVLPRRWGILGVAPPIGFDDDDGGGGGAACVLPRR